MSLDAQDWVWEHSASKGTARLVILAIADKASGPECSAYAGTTFLVKRSNAARSAVVVGVDKLLASGELEVIKDRKGPRGETCYRLPMAVGHRRTGGPESGPVRNQDPSGNRTPGGPESGPTRSGNRTPTSPESGPQNTRNAGTPEGTHVSKGGATADAPQRDYAMKKFGDFWLVYPKQRSIEKAKTAWRAAIDRGVDPDHMVTAATAYANACANKDPQFIKFPANWLDHGCYDDAPDPEPQAPPAAQNGTPTHPTWNLEDYHSGFAS